MEEYTIETQCVASDFGSLERWEALCAMFPDLIGLGDTEEEAIAVLIFQVTSRSFH